MPFDGATCPQSPFGGEGVRSPADKWFRDPAGGKLFWNGITYGPYNISRKGFNSLILFFQNFIILPKENNKYEDYTGN